MRATWLVEFACATMAADACIKMEYLAKLADSSAISTSSIRPSAERMLVSCDFILSAANASRDIPAPVCALKKTTFSIAFSKTPADTWLSPLRLLESHLPGQWYEQLRLVQFRYHPYYTHHRS